MKHVWDICVQKGLPDIVQSNVLPSMDDYFLCLFTNMALTAAVDAHSKESPFLSVGIRKRSIPYVVPVKCYI